jgi:hypothetical protein
MSAKGLLSAAVVVAIGAACLASSPEAQAENKDWCAIVAADKTIDWAAGQMSVKAESPSTSYGHAAPGGGSCNAYLVDINVTPATAKSPGQPSFSLIGFDPAREGTSASVYGYTVNVPEAECSQWVQSVSIYKKAQGASGFSYVGGGIERGVWKKSNGGLFNQSVCQVVPESTFKQYGAFMPPASGTDTYRVAFSAHLGTAPAHAGAFGEHLPAQAQ